MTKLKECPILKNAGISLGDGAYGDPDDDWKKNICIDCLLSKCVLQGGKMSAKDKMVLEKLEDKTPQQAKARWSLGGQIFFCDGYAWGTARNLKTVRLGTEQEVLKLLEDNKPTGNNVLDNILTLERNAR